MKQPASYETSLVEDLRDVRHELIEFLADGTVRSLGFLGRRALTSAPEDDYIRLAGEKSARLALLPLLGTGFHRLAIRSRHQGEPFYSWITATLDNGGSEHFRILFRNELETDRSCLHFSVFLQ